MTTTITDLEREIEALNAAVTEIQVRLDILIVASGETPSDDALEQMAALRMERTRLAVERSRAQAQLRGVLNAATHRIEFVLADGDTATFSRAHEPLRALLGALQDDGVIVNWKYADA